MKTKTLSSIFFIVAFLIISCQVETATEVPVTQPAITITTKLPTDVPSLTPLPTFSAFPIFSPVPSPIPYPTASAVQANTVAFVVQDWQKHGPSSLWVANTDGSGEKKIVDKIDELENGMYVSFTAVTWSPDGLQIAYAQGVIGNAPLIIIGLIDMATGVTSEVLSYQSLPPPITLLWSPDGHYLLLSKYSYFFVLDVTTRKVVKEIKAAGNCSAYHRGLAWSPNGKWFYHIQVGNGRFSTTQICISGLDGSSRQIDIGGTATSYPVWDKRGNFLYFVAANTNFSNTPLPDYDLRLMRYDVRTQKQERLLSLGKEPNRWVVTISPDGQTLELHTIDQGDLHEFVFMDMKSLSVTKFSVNLEIPVTVAFQVGTAWAPDNKNLILYIGRTHTPDGVGIRPYGAFYTLNIQTGETAIFSGSHNIELGEWAVSPIATSS